MTDDEQNRLIAYRRGYEDWRRQHVGCTCVECFDDEIGIDPEFERLAWMEPEQ